MCCSPWDFKELYITEQLNSNNKQKLTAIITDKNLDLNSETHCRFSKFHIWYFSKLSPFRYIMSPDPCYDLVRYREGEFGWVEKITSNFLSRLNLWNLFPAVQGAASQLLDVALAARSLFSLGVPGGVFGFHACVFHAVTIGRSRMDLVIWLISGCAVILHFHSGS